MPARSKRPKHPVESDAEDSDPSLDSDALDEEEVRPKKRKPAVKKASPRKKARKQKKEEDSEEDASDNDSDHKVVDKLVEAPKTGRVPAGQISQNTFNFLTELTNPEHNDRKWFKLHDAVFRLAEKEWRDFIEEFTVLLTEVDPQVPPLPPKDVIHRIYNDIRFKRDKTPYKTCLSASMSRNGRKGNFAGYHVMIKPGGHTFFGGGVWQPAKQQLDFIRTNIKRNPSRLREVISDPTFVSYFGNAQPHPKGQRQNIFGSSDELKVAPKGVDKDHPDIDLLKCRSFTVHCNFTDKEVLSPDFKNQLKKMAEVIRPLVHCMNDMMSVISEDTDGEGSGADDDDAE